MNNTIIQCFCPDADAKLYAHPDSFFMVCCDKCGLSGKARTSKGEAISAWDTMMTRPEFLEKRKKGSLMMKSTVQLLKESLEIFENE